MHHVRFILFCDEVPRFVLGQADIHLGEEFSEFAIGVELLAASGGGARSGAEGSEESSIDES